MKMTDERDTNEKKKKPNLDLIVSEQDKERINSFYGSIGAPNHCKREFEEESDWALALFMLEDDLPPALTPKR